MDGSRPGNAQHRRLGGGIERGAHRIGARGVYRLDVPRGKDAELGEVPAVVVPRAKVPHRVEGVSVLADRAGIAYLDPDSPRGAGPAACVQETEVVAQLMGSHLGADSEEVSVDHRPVAAKGRLTEPRAAALPRKAVDEVLIARQVDPGGCRGRVGVILPSAVRAAGRRAVEPEPAKDIPIRIQLSRQRDRAVGLLLVESID